MFWGLVILAAMPISAAPGVEYYGVSEELINGLPLQSPQSLAVNPRREEFLVADALNDRVVIFDTLGRAVFDFALGDGRKNPFGIAVNSREEIFVSAMDSPEIWVYDYDGRYLETYYLDQGMFPGRLLIEDDLLYLVDRAGGGIIAINQAGHVTQHYIVESASTKPAGLFFDGEGNLVLVSMQGDVLTAMGPDGTIRYKLGEHGRLPQDFSHPTSAAGDKSGNLWVVDSFRHHIKRFDPDHAFMDIIGRRGTGAGEFYFPVDLKMTPSGKLGVLEKGTGRLQLFRVNDE